MYIKIQKQLVKTRAEMQRSADEIEVFGRSGGGEVHPIFTFQFPFPSASHLTHRHQNSTANRQLVPKKLRYFFVNFSLFVTRNHTQKTPIIVEISRITPYKPPLRLLINYLTIPSSNNQSCIHDISH